MKKESLKINVDIHYEDDVYVVTNKTIEGALGWGKTKEEAIDDFCKFLEVISEEHLNRIDNFAKTDQGKREIPYLEIIKNASSINDIKNMLVI